MAVSGKFKMTWEFKVDDEFFEKKKWHEVKTTSTPTEISLEIDGKVLFKKENLKS
jgi:hypothetical protein